MIFSGFFLFPEDLQILTETVDRLLQLIWPLLEYALE